MSVIDEITAERKRQIEIEGYNADHDDEHTDGDIALAACCYAAPVPLYVKDERANAVIYKDPWPWDDRYDKRSADGNVIIHPRGVTIKERRRLLVKAGALIVAEIDRLDRIAAKKSAA